MADSNSFDKSLLFIPEGVRDVYGKECLEREYIRRMIQKEMKLYGFSDIRTPSYEFFDIFNKERGTVDSTQMFKFFDRYNNTLVLRPDHTPQIARCVARYYADEDMQLRLCYTGNTFIHQGGYQGKLSETTQIGAEIIGDASSDVDTEMLTMTIECLIRSGLKDFQVDIGHAGILHGLVTEASLEPETVEKLREYIVNKNSHAVHELLKDRDIPDGVREILIRMPELFGEDDPLAFIKERTDNEETMSAIERLEKIYEVLKSIDLGTHITLDPGMPSHYDYYTGVIFKAFTYGTGEAIASGGRYDNLMAQFGKNVPAVGVVFLLDQLMDALFSEKVSIPVEKETILVLYRSVNRHHAISLITRLRGEGHPAYLMRKNADISLEEYKAYGKRRGLKEIRYIDDTGEETLLEL